MILNIAVIVLAVLLLIVIVMLSKNVHDQKKLRQEVNKLNKTIESHNKDIAGLCSAAVNVDNKLFDFSEQLDDMLNEMVQIKQEETYLPPNKKEELPYQKAINMVRQGCDVEQLIQQCQLSYDEAVLLMRLHGGKADGSK